MRFLFLPLLLLFQLCSFAQGWYPPDACDDSPYFSFQNEYGKFGVEDSTCTVVLPPLYDFVYLNRTPTDNCGRVDSIAILIDSNGAFAYNLNSRVRTEYQQFMIVVNDFVLFSDSVNWGAYNFQLKKIRKRLSGRPLAYSYCNNNLRYLPFGSDWNHFYENEEAHSGPYYNYDECMYMTMFPDLIFNDNILWQEFAVDAKYHPITTQKQAERYYRFLSKRTTYFDLEYRLIDLKSNRKTKDKYHNIQPVIYDNEIYYWCYKILEEKRDSNSRVLYNIGYVDIFDAQLKRLNHVSFDQMPSYFRVNVYQEQYIMNQYDTNLLNLITNKGKSFGVNMAGEEIISNANTIEKVHYGTYKVRYNDSVRLYNDRGRRLHEKAYVDIIRPWNLDSLLIVKLDTTQSSWAVHDYFGDAFLSGFDTIVPHYRPENTPQKFSVSKDGKLFLVDDYHLTAIDSANHDFQIGAATYAPFVINKRGEILGTWTKIPFVSDQGIVFLDGNTVIIVDKEGKISARIPEVKEVRGYDKGSPNRIALEMLDRSYITVDRHGNVIPKK